MSRYGAIALASSLDQVGPVTRTVLDAGLLHDVIGGHDPHDSTSLTDAWPSFAEAAREGARGDVLRGLKVGVIRELPDERLPGGRLRVVPAALATMEAQGAEIVEISAPHFEYGVAAYYLILPAEASSNLAKFDSVRFGMRVTPHAGSTVEEVMAATRDAGFGDEVKRRIILGTYALSAGYYDAYYGSAQKVRTLIQRDFDDAFAQVDVIATPSAPTTAFRARREDRRPAADVPQRRHHDSGEPRRRPRDLASHRDSPRRTACRSASSSWRPPVQDARLYRVGAALEALLVDALGRTAAGSGARSSTGARDRRGTLMAKAALMDYDKALELFEPVLGFEVHVELNTETKMFSAAANPANSRNHGAPPNTLVAPVDLGLPGSLPVVNEQAIALLDQPGPRARLLDRAVQPVRPQELLLPGPRQELPDLASTTSRSPSKAPSMSNSPTARTVTVPIERAHMEEDAGKLTHVGGSTGRIQGAEYSLVDYNRAGVPLVEIVTQGRSTEPSTARPRSPRRTSRRSATS